MSIFNPIFFYQHLLVHHPHQTEMSLHHLHDDNMPPSVKYFFKAVELKPQEQSSHDTILAEFDHEGHEADFLNTIVSKKKKPATLG